METYSLAYSASGADLAAIIVAGGDECLITMEGDDWFLHAVEDVPTQPNTHTQDAQDVPFWYLAVAFKHSLPPITVFQVPLYGFSKPRLKGFFRLPA